MRTTIRKVRKAYVTPRSGLQAALGGNVNQPNDMVVRRRHFQGFQGKIDTVPHCLKELLVRRPSPFASNDSECRVGREDDNRENSRTIQQLVGVMVRRRKRRSRRNPGGPHSSPPSPPWPQKTKKV